MASPARAAGLTLTAASGGGAAPKLEAVTAEGRALLSALPALFAGSGSSARVVPNAAFASGRLVLSYTLGAQGDEATTSEATTQ